MIELYEYQKEAVAKMHNGCILCGSVGSGKSITAIAYYFFKNGGALDNGKYTKMSGTPPDLYIITTAKKRDSHEWEKDLAPFCLAPETGVYKSKTTIDSWNNISKYKDVRNAFFIFDEQRVVGSGAWVKSFLAITRSNEWVLLSATPGDKWEDYIPVFIANGFYKNKTDFSRQHIVYSRTVTKYPKVDRYLNTGRLIRLRSRVLVRMNYQHEIKKQHISVPVEYDMDLYKRTIRTRWNPYQDSPITGISELCYVLRKITNIDISRLEAVKEIMSGTDRAIIFYCFDYELEALKNYDFGPGVKKAEWNGHKHQPIPRSKKWIYLVQYTAGSEGWNCILTDTIIFYSQHYSYKTMVQAAGRIDRLNTPFDTLYYYHLTSKSGIDVAITKALKQKKKFNESAFIIC